MENFVALSGWSCVNIGMIFTETFVPLSDLSCVNINTYTNIHGCFCYVVWIIMPKYWRDIYGGFFVFCVDTNEPYSRISLCKLLRIMLRKYLRDLREFSQFGAKVEKHLTSPCKNKLKRTISVAPKLKSSKFHLAKIN